MKQLSLLRRWRFAAMLAIGWRLFDGGDRCRGQQVERAPNLYIAAAKTARMIEQRIRAREIVVQNFAADRGFHQGFAAELEKQLRYVGFRVVDTAEERSTAYAAVSGSVEILPSNEAGANGEPIGLRMNLLLMQGKNFRELVSLDVLDRREGERWGGDSREVLPPPGKEVELRRDARPTVTTLRREMPVEPGARPRELPQDEDLPEKPNETIARPHPDSPYGVGVLRKRREGLYKECPLAMAGDNFQVKLKRGDVYALQLINDSAYDAAVWVFVDGMPRDILASQKPNSSGLADLVERRNKRLIKGWYLNDNEDREFLLTDFQQRLAARVGPQPDQPREGGIVIEFAAAWSPSEQGPPNEPPQLQSLGTTEGKLIESRTQLVSPKIGQVRARIKIYYQESRLDG